VFIVFIAMGMVAYPRVRDFWSDKRKRFESSSAMVFKNLITIERITYGNPCKVCICPFHHRLHHDLHNPINGTKKVKPTIDIGTINLGG
jgi:hypothetical protein